MSLDLVSAEEPADYPCEDGAGARCETFAFDDATVEIATNDREPGSYFMTYRRSDGATADCDFLAGSGGGEGWSSPRELAEFVAETGVVLEPG